MKLYTVHEPPYGGGELELIPEGFSWFAFLFSVIWALWHRLWLEALGFMGLTLALNLIMAVIDAGEPVRAFSWLALHVLIGFEARDLRRAALARRGWRALGVVGGADREAAERRFLDLRDLGRAPVF